MKPALLLSRKDYWIKRSYWKSQYISKMNENEDVTLVWNANDGLECKRWTWGTWIWLHFYLSDDLIANDVSDREYLTLLLVVMNTKSTKTELLENDGDILEQRKVTRECKRYEYFPGWNHIIHVLHSDKGQGNHSLVHK